ncbi:hypothetical protein V6N13_040365 [Hibiscus sabdariffa]
MCKCHSLGTFPLFSLQSSLLNICYYHQDLHRRPLRPGSRPEFYGDRRALLLIGAWPLPRRLGIGHALKRHPFSGLVDLADSLVRVSRRAGWGACRPTPGARWCRSTPRRRVLGSTIEVTTSPRAYQRPGLGPPPRSASVHAPSRSADLLLPFHIRPGSITGPHLFPSRQFQALFDSLFKVLFIFPSRYMFAIGLSPVFSFGRNIPPDSGCIPKQPDSQTTPRRATGSGHDGALTLSDAPFQGTWARSAAEDASPYYNSDAEGDRFSSWAIPGSLAVTKGILAGFDNDPSAGSPTETLLRLLLPLNDKLFVFHKSKNFTSDYEIRMPPTVPVNHYSDPEVQHNRIRILAGGTTRPIKARSTSPVVGTSRPVLTVRRTGRPTPRSNYELFNCNNLNIRYWSWNYRGCWHQTCPPMDPR